MKLRWIATALVTAGFIAMAAAANAQGLNDVVNRLLSNNCARAGPGALRAGSQPTLPGGGPQHRIRQLVGRFRRLRG